MVVCAVARSLGILAVTLDSEALGYAAVGIVLAGILAGPVVARAAHAQRGTSRTLTSPG